MKWWTVCTVALAVTSANAQELSGGVAVGGILAGTSSRLSVSPHAGLAWQTSAGFVFGLHDVCSILPEMNGLGVGVYNHASLLVGYGSRTMHIGVGPSLSFYSMPMCGVEWCAPATGTAIGGSGRTYLHLAGPLGLSALVSVEYVNNPVMPGGVTMMATAGPVLRWRER